MWGRLLNLLRVVPAKGKPMVTRRTFYVDSGDGVGVPVSEATLGDSAGGRQRYGTPRS